MLTRMFGFCKHIVNENRLLMEIRVFRLNFNEFHFLLFLLLHAYVDNTNIQSTALLSNNT
jgi:hypothetical protein